LSIAREPATEQSAVPRRKRGRPLEMQPHEVLSRIREMAMRNALFRVHLDAPSLYARARRQFARGPRRWWPRAWTTPPPSGPRADVPSSIGVATSRDSRAEICRRVANGFSEFRQLFVTRR
jgi:hypothetical protein